MVQRIQAKLRGWRKIGASRSVINLLRHGHLIRWADLPPDPFYFPSRPLPLVESQWLLGEIVRGLGTGAWEPALSDQFCSAVFVVPKKNGGYRLVIDMRHLNEHVAPATCHYETLKHLPNMVHQSDWFFAIDLQDGFNCIPIAQRHRQYFTFTVNFSNLPAADVARLTTDHGLHPVPGTSSLFRLQMSALCFGYAASPLLFTKVMRQVVKFWRRHGVRCMPYVDDFLFMNKSRRQGGQHRALIRRTLDMLGLLASEKKSHWELTQQIEHLGLIVDSQRGLFLVPPVKTARIQCLASTLTAHARTHRRWVSARRLASFAGLAQSVHLACAPARFFTRSLHVDLATRRSWDSDVKLSPQTLRDLDWWRKFDTQYQHRALWRPTTTLTMWTDAAGGARGGWGGMLSETTVARGFFAPHQQRYHITVKELVAVTNTVRALITQCRGHTIRLWEDNQAVVWILTNGCSKSPEIMSELRQLWWLLAKNDITILPEYIPSALNPADYWSRIHDSDDWRLARHWFDLAERRWGRHTVDLFATALNCQVPCGTIQGGTTPTPKRSMPSHNSGTARTTGSTRPGT
jgi:hypothetical protein